MICATPSPPWPCRTAWTSKPSPVCWATTPPASPWTPTPMSLPLRRRKRLRLWGMCWQPVNPQLKINLKGAREHIACALHVLVYNIQRKKLSILSKPFRCFPRMGQGMGQAVWLISWRVLFCAKTRKKFRKPRVFGTLVVAGDGFEPTTSGLQIECSCQLS